MLSKALYTQLTEVQPQDLSDVYSTWKRLYVSTFIPFILMTSCAKGAGPLANTQSEMCHLCSKVLSSAANVTG